MPAISKKQLIGIVVVTAAALFMIFGYTNRQGADSDIILRSSSPRNYSRNINTKTTIVLTYDNTLPDGYGENNISIEPEINGNYIIEGNKIIIVPKHELLHSTDYYIKVALSNDNSKEKTIRFTTRQNDDPRTVFINQTLPIVADGYWIEYVSTGNYFVVTISKEPTEEYSEQAIKALEKNGITELSDEIRVFTSPSI